jgi:hypothetical protein
MYDLVHSNFGYKNLGRLPSAAPRAIVACICSMAGFPAPLRLQQDVQEAEEPQLAMPPTSKARPSTYSVLDTQRDAEDAFLQNLATLDATPAEEFPEFMSSLTISVDLEAWQPGDERLQDQDNIQSLGAIQGRYHKLGEIGNGSSIYRQVENPNCPDQDQLMMVYFNGKDTKAYKAIE